MPDDVTAKASYVFRHALVRDAAYELQPPSLRAALHAHAVRVFERMFGAAPGYDSRRHFPIDPYVGEIALHAAAAAEAGQDDVRAIRDACLKRAGRLAARQYRHDDARRYWTLLLEHADSAADRVLALHHLGHNAAAVQRRDEARDFQQRALEEAENCSPDERASIGRVVANARISLSYTYYWGGDIETALALAQQVADEPPDAEVHSVALRALGNFQLRGGQPMKAMETLLRALETLGEAARPDQRADLLGAVAVAELEQGLIENSLAHFDEALDCARAAGYRLSQSMLAGNKAAALLAAGRDGEAMEQMRRSLEIAREIGQRRIECQAIGNISNSRLALGETEGVEDGYRRALEIAHETGDRRSVSLWTGNMGMFHSEHGAPEQAEKELLEALSIAREIGEPGLGGGWLCSYAIHLERHGDRAAALKNWREGENILRTAAPGVLHEVGRTMRQLCEERQVDFEATYGGSGHERSD